MKRNLSSNISRLRSELERRLIVMRYSKVATSKYMQIFSWVEDYLDGYGEVNYTKVLGQRFLVEYSLQENHSPNLFLQARTIIRRIDKVLENKQFAPRFSDFKMECPTRFIYLLDKYLESLVKLSRSKSTLTTRKRYAIKLLKHLPETITTIEKLSATDLYDIFTKYEWCAVALITAKNVLSFLFENGITKTNLSVCVPRPIRPRALPSIYSYDEVAQLISSAERTTSLGKRDYAILILAAYIGLRSCDIAGLTFKDINYTEKTIEIVQVKTARPLTLVMNSEVEEALTDYIQNGRPQSSSDKIFLRYRAPFSPITAAACFSVTNKHFNLAGIAAQGRRRGAHALRASYATALVTKGVPYAVVQEALGHEDPESAKYYVRVDVRRLRMCALNVPNPTGAFAVMIEPNIHQTLSSSITEGALL